MKYNFPPGYSFFTTYKRAIQLVNNPLESIIESVERFGESYSVFAGTKRMILTQDPEFIEYILKKNHKNYYKSKMVSENLARFLGNGLLTSNGPYWLKQRRLIQPGFHVQKIQRLYDIMQKTIDESLSKFPTGDQINVLPVMNAFAFEVVINTLFDVEIPAQSVAELSQFISETQEFVIRNIRQPHKRWWHVLSGEVRKNQRNSGRSRAIIREIIRQRKASGKKFNDLLDMLLDARYEDTSEPMDEEQILDEILVLIIAGHETTANALTWTLYLLAGHPKELQRLRNEIRDKAIPEIVSNKLLSAVLQESMRLYPPAWASDRVALEADSFKEYSYPKDTIIVIFYYGLHRSERHWADATAFSPSRFEHGDKVNAYYPFGGGPRLCIGNNFAMAEMALFLQSFIHRFEIERTAVEPRVRALITLRPENVMLSVRRKAVIG